jgi:predicted  nucleic acid-binding Zn-ribbon protein
MNIEDFRSLIEIQSLERKVKEHLDKIDSHHDRVTHLKKIRVNKEQESSEKAATLENLKKDISSNEKELYEAEKKISKSKENLEIAANEQQVNAIQKELDTLVPVVEELELATLESLEQSELLQIEVDELSEFLKGSKETLEEITIEVKNDVEAENKEIENYNFRSENLLSTLDKQVQTAFISVNKKYKFKDPLCFADSDSCNKCHYGIPRQLLGEIERGNIVEYCPNCGRIIAPISAKLTS